jgi:hypothetical protein
VPHGAGIVHQCGDPAQFGIDPVKQRDHFVFDADIGTHGNALAPSARTCSSTLWAACSSD